MTKIDQFESVFRAADKPVYEHAEPELYRILVVTDLAEPDAEQFTGLCRAMLRAVPAQAEWRTLTGDRFGDVAELLEQVDEHNPNMVCTYRHLHSRAWKWPYGLGEHLDVLTQIAPCPVMVFPHPDRGGTLEHALQNCDRVMAITDHLTGDHRLVSWAVRFTETGGRLLVTHVEDQAAFDRFIAAVAKIPNLDTDQTREAVRERLLADPTDYVESCRRVLDGARPDVIVEAVITVGHRLADHKRLVSEHRIDLLVMNTQEDGQFAMHGLAYPLAVDLRSIPVLML